MERLTTRNSMGIAVYKNPFECERCGETIYRLPDYGNGSPTEKLADYEEAEEQRLFVHLPCKVGDIVWDNDYGKPCAYTITAFSFGECEGYIDEPVATKEVVFYYTNSNGNITGSFAESEIGKSVFLSKSEAEAKLKETEENNND